MSTARSSCRSTISPSERATVVRTKEITVRSAMTLVVQVSGKATMLNKTTRPTFRVQLDGNVSLNKQAKPLEI